VALSELAAGFQQAALTLRPSLPLGVECTRVNLLGGNCEKGKTQWRRRSKSRITVTRGDFKLKLEKGERSRFLPAQESSSFHEWPNTMGLLSTPSEGLVKSSRAS
jgi:hypothetical protein